MLRIANVANNIKCLVARQTDTSETSKRKIAFYFLLSIAAAEAVEELLLLVVVTPWFSRDFASKCNGFVSRLEDTEATECRPDKCVLFGTILSRNFRLSFRKFYKIKFSLLRGQRFQS